MMQTITINTIQGKFKALADVKGGLAIHRGIADSCDATDPLRPFCITHVKSGLSMNPPPGMRALYLFHSKTDARAYREELLKLGDWNDWADLKDVPPDVFTTARFVMMNWPYLPGQAPVSKPIPRPMIAGSSEAPKLLG